MLKTAWILKPLGSQDFSNPVVLFCVLVQIYHYFRIQRKNELTAHSFHTFSIGYLGCTNKPKRTSIRALRT